ncbi:STAS domain-containing protein [Polyangium sp. 6x1]|uniref:STAS domain-containing protein n=1 Tax=Polyangium sp. 6x1 TaxID=3042689 RepID=UPI0024828AD4|nr:STAS domain-containing protein [Polyangium sp. 6x1]MDI1448596.1 STAS domain-containing protein [Polyangium sp. 6x1]
MLGIDAHPSAVPFGTASLVASSGDMDDTMETAEARLHALHEELTLVRGALGEREQELGCVQAFHDLTRRDTMPLGELFQRMVDLVPLAFLEGEPIAARVTIADQRFVTPGFREADGIHPTSIVAGEQDVGVLEVRRVGDSAGEESFSLQKRRFLALVADCFGEVVQRRFAADQQKRLAEELEAERETLQRGNHEAEERLHLIERMQQAILELSVPVLEIWDRVLLVPLAGLLDSRRAAQAMDSVLAAIKDRQPRFVLMDITGVLVVDTATAGYLLQIAQAASLLGAPLLLTGIRPNVAQTIVSLGLHIGDVRTCANVRDGLRECMRRMGRP